MWLVRAQGYECAFDICDKAVGPDGPRDHLDHDHETGQVRSVLCPRHNRTAVSGEELRSALRYLEGR